MSKILDELKSKGDDNGRCHVRVSDNMTYGPVALTTVCQWAAQGRVTAESEISFDREEWVRADSIPELGLEWVASSDGADDFGPFNLTALSALVRRGLISPDARLKHRETDEALDVPQALERAAAARPLDAAASRLLQTVQATGAGEGASAVSDNGALATDGAPAESDALESELRQELAAAQAEGRRLAEQLRVEQDGWDSLKGELRRAQEVLADTRARQEALQAESDAREIEQGGRIAELEELLNVAQEGREAADAERQAAREAESTHVEHGEQKELELQKLRSRVEEVENAVAAAHERGAELEAERDKLKADTTDLASQLEEAVAQQSATRIALDESIEGHGTLERAASEAAAQAAGRIGALEAELAGVQTALSERTEEISLLAQTHEARQQSATEKAEGLAAALAAAQAAGDERETVLASETAGITAQLSETREAAAQREAEWGLQVDQLRKDVSGLTERLSLSEAHLKEEQVDAGTLGSKLDVARQKVKAQEKQIRSLTRKLANRDKKVIQFKRDLKARDKTITSLSAAAPKAEARIVGLEAAVAAGAAEIEAMRSEAHALTTAQSDHHATVTEHVELTSKVEQEKQQLEARVAELTAALTQAQSASEEAQAGHTSLASELAEVRSAEVSLRAQLEQARAEQAEAAAAHAARQAEQEAHLSEQEAHVTEHVNQGTRIEAEKHALASRVAELEKALAGRDDIEAEHKKALAGKDAALADVKQSLADKSAALEAATRTADDKHVAVEEVQKALAGKSAALADAEKALAGKDQALEDAKTALTAAVTATDDLLAEHGKLETAQAADRTAADKLREDLKQAESAAAKLKVELDAARAEAVKPAPEPEPSKEWYLRYDDANMLGPVSFEVLVQWAKDCRVAHDHDVSSDKIFWAKAADVPELAMEWMVALVDGTDYGPINKHAIHDLIADGAVAKDAELTRAKTGETLTASDITPE